MNEFLFEASDEAGTDRLAQCWQRPFRLEPPSRLCGTLGAGKTRLVQAIAAAYGVPREEVVSPTFVLVQQYQGSRRMNHLDAYRLHDEDEFRELGVEELLASDATTVIEWADRIPAALPHDHLLIEIEVTGHTSRRFIFRSVGDQLECVVEALRSALR